MAPQRALTLATACVAFAEPAFTGWADETGQQQRAAGFRQVLEELWAASTAGQRLPAAVGRAAEKLVETDTEQWSGTMPAAESAGIALLYACEFGSTFRGDGPTLCARYLVEVAERTSDRRTALDLVTVDGRELDTWVARVVSFIDAWLEDLNRGATTSELSASVVVARENWWATVRRELSE
jgi:hypothetical protein